MTDQPMQPIPRVESLFQHRPHPRLAELRQKRPPVTGDERVGFKNVSGYGLATVAALVASG